VRAGWNVNKSHFEERTKAEDDADGATFLGGTLRNAGDLLRAVGLFGAVASPSAPAVASSVPVYLRAAGDLERGRRAPRRLRPMGAVLGARAPAARTAGARAQRRPRPKQHWVVALRLQAWADRLGLLLSPPKLRDWIVTRRHRHS